MKKSSKTTFVDKTLAAARILSFLKENSDKKYSNKSIATELGLSNSTVSSITGRLSALGELNLPAIKKSKSVLTPLFQYSKNSNVNIEVERDRDDAAVAVQIFLDKNKNKEYTKSSIVTGTGYSEGSVGNAIHALLLTGRVKITCITSAVKFQSIKGNKKAVEVSFNIDSTERMTISEYVKRESISKEIESSMRKSLTKTKFSLVYSSNGFRRTYSIEDLEKASKKKKTQPNVLNKFLFNLDTGKWVD